MVEKTAEAPKKYLVKMLRGYWPADPDHPQHEVMGGPQKVRAGETCLLNAEEAKKVIKDGIAVRADPIP